MSYLVLTEKAKYSFEHHQQAFNFCEMIPETIKGVFLDLGDKAGGLNVWGGWGATDTLLAAHSLIKKVV